MGAVSNQVEARPQNHRQPLMLWCVYVTAARHNTSGVGGGGARGWGGVRGGWGGGGEGAYKGKGVYLRL